VKTLVASILGLLLYSSSALAGDESINLHATNTALGIAALCLFVFAYLFVMTEEFTHLRKSKPVVFAAGLIWLLVAIMGTQSGHIDHINLAVRSNILEFAELFMFLLVAMTYINSMEERLVFESLRTWLVRRGFSYRQLFWVTGLLAFSISPFADNLTTALLMCAVVLAVGTDSPKFISLSCINIVVAANAGGAFSPFGDITTLMVWQSGKLCVVEFFNIFIPALASYLLPACLISFAIPKESPNPDVEQIAMRFGAKRVILLFLCTIATAILFHYYFLLPSMIGMMTGLGYLNFFAFYLKRKESEQMKIAPEDTPSSSIDVFIESQPFDIFNKIKRAEWDTLFFFYGVILSVGGLATIGYLEIASVTMYQEWGSSLAPIHQATPANIMVGLLSAIVDNIPVIYSVLTMDPTMSDGQWLLVTLTAGIGGSLLSIGSAAGVALMGQSKGMYTFISHLKWSWAIFLGYVLGITLHLYMNSTLF
jgi:Na+/H+ antiporter NhaD/arsenite permease-like protein